MEGQLRDVIRRKIIDALERPLPELTRRDIHVPGVPGKAVAVIGMRRAGKTSLLWQILGQRLARGTAREGLLYFSFEDERLAGMKAADLQIVLEEYYRLHPDWRDRRRATLFLDEIHEVTGWEAFARRLLDSESLDLFLSGSSARLLSREVASSMRGRGMEAVVYPFSFREALRHQGREPSRPPERLGKAARSGLDKDLREYLRTGGFPEAQGAAPRDRVDLLRSYIDVTLLRDVIERHSVSHPVALRWMARHLLANAAGAFSVHKLHGALHSQGIAVGKDTLHAYLDHLKDTFLVDTVAVAGGSERRRMVNPQKVYPVDPALAPIYRRAGQPEIGHALETSVFLELRRRGMDVGYVRTARGHEVDFLARDVQGREALIQVCANLDEPATQARESRALLAAAEEHPRAARLLVTLTPETAGGVPASIVVLDAACWLLADDLLSG